MLLRIRSNFRIQGSESDLLRLACGAESNVEVTDHRVIAACNKCSQVQRSPHPISTTLYCPSAGECATVAVELSKLG